MTPSASETGRAVGAAPAIPVGGIEEPRASYGGPAILRQGFRPFFLAAALWAIAAILLWLPMLMGRITLPTAFDPLAWHAHEMIFGFVAAAVAGFLLTAIPNWTGRLPLRGWPLLGLFAAWAAGRVAVGVSASIGGVAAAIVDAGFLALLFGFVLREILAGRNWRNLPVTLAVASLIAANVLMHAENLGWIGPDGLGARLGIAIVVVLISLIGGRIVPSFTRNWLVKRGVEALPVPFGRFDRLCVLTVAVALLAWTGWPLSKPAALLLLLAGIASLVRLQRWQGHRTLAEPLLWSLHLAFLWLPSGLLLLGAAGLTAAVPSSAGLHALTAGAAASMIVAVMTRATLGHTGRELEADRMTTAIYLLVFAAAALRLAAAFLVSAHMPLLMASAGAWVAAFLLFAFRYGPMMFGARG